MRSPRRSFLEAAPVTPLLDVVGLRGPISTVSSPGPNSVGLREEVIPPSVCRSAEAASLALRRHLHDVGGGLEVP